MKRFFSISLIVLSTLLALQVTALAVSEKADYNSYSDLASDWYRASAEEFGYHEIFADGNLFHPTQAITRLEYARMLHRALGIEINYFAATDIGDYFSDMDNEDVGASALYDLVTAGIMEKAECFWPNEPLAREDMIHYTITALKYVTNGEYALIMMLPNPFDDDASISEPYKSDIIEAVLLQLIRGRGDNMLYPKDNATRAEAVVLTGRLVRLRKDLTSNVTVTSTAEETVSGLKMSLIIENSGDKTVSIDHTSGQMYDFKVLDIDGSVLYTWSADKLFIAALSTTQIQAGQSVEYSAELNTEAYLEIKSKAASVKAYIVGTSADFSIDPEGYTARIS